MKSRRGLLSENPGGIQRPAGADYIFRLSGFQQIVIDSLYPFLQHSSRVKGAEVKLYAILSATLSGVIQQADQATKLTRHLSAVEGTYRLPVSGSQKAP